MKTGNWIHLNPTFGTYDVLSPKSVLLHSIHSILESFTQLFTVVCFNIVDSKDLHILRHWSCCSLCGDLVASGSYTKLHKNDQLTETDCCLYCVYCLSLCVCILCITLNVSHDVAQTHWHVGVSGAQGTRLQRRRKSTHVLQTCWTHEINMKEHNNVDVLWICFKHAMHILWWCELCWGAFRSVVTPKHFDAASEARSIEEDLEHCYRRRVFPLSKS